jgi:acyl-CoA dehydrogenase
VRRFIQDEFLPQQARWRDQHHPDAAAWLSAGRVGLLLPDVPLAYGGGGGSYAHACVVVEELARAGVSFGAGVQSIVSHYLLAYGTEEQKSNWLPRMARGELVASIAMTEPGAGSDLAGIKTTAQRDGDHYLINGSKTFITNGLHAGLVCIAARTSVSAPGTRAISIIVAETQGLAGYTVGRPLEKVGMHGQDTCEMYFQNVRVPAANLLGTTEGRGFTQMMQQLPYERLSIAVAAIAMAEVALKITTRYAQERLISGKPLFELQNTRFKLAECAADVRVGRVFIDDCVGRFLAGALDDARAAVSYCRRLRAVAWRLRLHDRVSDSAHVARQPRAAHLRRLQRDHEGSYCLVTLKSGWSRVLHGEATGVYA